MDSESIVLEQSESGHCSIMEVIDSIPVEFDTREILRTMKAGRLRRLEDKSISALLDRGRRLIDPKAVYTFLGVKTIERDEVHLDGGHTLASVVLADMLERDQEIAAHVVTIGPRLEKEVSEAGRSSVFRAWVLENMGDHALAKAGAYVRSRIEERLGNAISGFGPGTGTGRLFGIEQQKVLFQILDPAKNIGVRLTPSYLMVPRKSVSGVFAATSMEYVACQYCPREKCQNRRKPFSGEYYSVRCENRDLS